MLVNVLTAFLLLILVAPGCVSNKKFNKAKKTAQEQYDLLNNSYKDVQTTLNNCKEKADALTRENSGLQEQVETLNNRNAFLKENNTTMLKQLEDLSVVTSTQAESIRQSLENIGTKDIYIQDLQKEMARKDSLNMALVMNLKGAIGNLDDKDINIKVDKGVVFIDISDKLLFTSGQYAIRPQAQEVLGKVAAVLKNQPHIEFMVEGHTDNVAYSKPPLLDNWDLSVKRATSVVRVLQKKFGLAPEHITAAGRSEYVPIASNDTAEGRTVNRRTRIVILPQLDQFFKLLEPHGNEK
jgi:chemotaxis protein MotB